MSLLPFTKHLDLLLLPLRLLCIVYLLLCIVYCQLGCFKKTFKLAVSCFSLFQKYVFIFKMWFFFEMCFHFQNVKGFVSVVSPSVHQTSRFNTATLKATMYCVLPIWLFQENLQFSGFLLG